MGIKLKDIEVEQKLERRSAIEVSDRLQTIIEVSFIDNSSLV